MDKNLQIITDLVGLYMTKVIGAILILVIGLWLSKVISKTVAKVMNNRKVDITLSKFTSSFVRILLIAFVVLAAISQVGIETTSFVAVLGAASFAVGLALQGSLSNFAAGVMLIIFRPIKVGDFIELGANKGNVEQIGIFTTLVEGENDKIFIIPNTKLMNDVIINHSYKKTHSL